MEENLHEISILVKRKMQESGSYDRNAYREYVDESIMFLRERGKLTDEDSDEEIQTSMMHMYDDVVDSLSENE